MDKDLVHIWMVTYNHENYIQKAIESVLMQKTDFEYTLIIGDDHSTDKTTDIIKEYAHKYPTKIKHIIHEKNLGPIENAVRIYKECKAKYMALLEGDDYWIDPLKLQKQVDLLEENPSYAFCFTDRDIVDENETILKRSSIPLNKQKELMEKDILSGFTPPTQTVVFRRKYLTLKLLEGLKKVFNGDTYLFSQFSTKGKVGYISSVTAAYRVNATGIYSKENYFTRLKCRLNTYRVLQDTIESKYHKHLRKAQTVMLQRLFVISLLEGKIKYNLVVGFKLLSHDIKHFDYSFIRALKLLLLKLLNPSKLITD